MAKRAKVRFCALICGEPKELFSVSDLPDGDLLIYLRSAKNISRTTGIPDQEILEQRYSVHPSHNSAIGVTTIKQTLALESGQTIEAFCTTKAIKSGGVQILFGRFTPDLRESNYTVRPRKKDTVINICDCDPDLETLAYVVLVSHSQGPDEIDHSELFDQKSIGFRGFRVIVAVTKFNRRSTTQGHLIPKLTGVPWPKGLPGAPALSRLPTYERLTIQDVSRECERIFFELNQISEELSKGIFRQRSVEATVFLDGREYKFEA